MSMSNLAGLIPGWTDIFNGNDQQVHLTLINGGAAGDHTVTGIGKKDSLLAVAVLPLATEARILGGAAGDLTVTGISTSDILTAVETEPKPTRATILGGAVGNLTVTGIATTDLLTDVRTAPLPVKTRIKGGAAGNLTVTGIGTGDVLTSVMRGEAVGFVEDFVGDTGATLPPQWAVNMETANITSDYLSGAGMGVYRILSDSTSEGQAGQLTGGDALHINMDNKPVVEFRARFAPAGAAPTADERIVIGLASAHANAEDSLDNVTSNCWFRVEGASLAIVVEIDDGTDVDDQASGVTLVKSAWTDFKIDCSDLTDVKMYIDGVEQSGGTLDLSGLGANTYLQPIVCIQRDAGAEVNSLDVTRFRAREGGVDLIGEFTIDSTNTIDNAGGTDTTRDNDDLLVEYMSAGSDLTSEFSIDSANTIDNAGGTSSAGRMVEVSYQDSGSDLLSEFSITAADTINNAAGTSSAGRMVKVSYMAADGASGDLTSEFIGSSLGITAANTINNAAGTSTAGRQMLVMWTEG